MQIDHQSRVWIAENLLLGTEPSTIEQILCNQGADPNQAREELALAQNSPYLAGVRRLRNRLAKRDWQLDVQRRLAAIEPEADGVPRHHKLSTHDFLHRYYKPSLPVIIEGALQDWPAVGLWNWEHLLKACPIDFVEVQMGRNADAEYESKSHTKKALMPFGEFIRKARDSSPTNDLYMTANNSDVNQQRLKPLWQEIGSLEPYLTGDKARHFLWIGPAGTFTPLHHDLTNNFMAQVMGRKTVWLVPAHESARMPNSLHCFANADPREVGEELGTRTWRGMQIHVCSIGPGDVLFLPIGCWHAVLATEDSATISGTDFLWENNFIPEYPKDTDY